MFLERALGNAAALAVAQQYGLVRLEATRLDLIQVQVQRYRIPDRRSLAQVIAAMQGDARLLLVQPNFLYDHDGGKDRSHAGARTSDEALPQYAHEKIRLGAAHVIAQGRRTVIAVIDSGVDRSHPELANAVAESFDAVAGTALKPDAHGTAIASILSARGRLTGVAPASRLLAIRAFAPESDGQVLATTYVLLRSIDWAHKRRARLFNMSFSGPRDEALRRVVMAAQENGAIFVAAAGNGGPKAAAAFPAAYPGVIAVTATDKDDAVYGDANRGEYVVAAAPGVDVLVAVPGGAYDVKSGTSFAAAHVSGVIALMLEREPNLTSEQVRERLAKSSVDLGPRGPDPMFGAGRIDALQTLETRQVGASEGIARPAAVRPTGTEPR